MSIEAGKLRHQIELQSATNSQSASGEVTQAWTTYATVWAELAPLAGREWYRGKSFGETVSHKIVIRYRADVNTKHRALFGSRVYLFNGVITPDEIPERLEI